MCPLSRGAAAAATAAVAPNVCTHAQRSNEVGGGDPTHPSYTARTVDDELPAFKRGQQVRGGTTPQPTPPPPQTRPNPIDIVPPPRPEPAATDLRNTRNEKKNRRSVYTGITCVYSRRERRGGFVVLVDNRGEEGLKRYGTPYVHVIILHDILSASL